MCISCPTMIERSLVLARRTDIPWVVVNLSIDSELIGKALITEQNKIFILFKHIQLITIT